jgi:predicted RecB family endonuclease
VGEAVADDCVLLLAADGTGVVGVGFVGVDGWRQAGINVATMISEANPAVLARRAIRMR